MEGKEPKFGGGQEFLNDERIFELERLVSEIIYPLTPKERLEPAFEELQNKWNKLQREYIDEAPEDSPDSERFRKFIEFKLKHMDLGGMNVGRHPVSKFIDQKAKELLAYSNKLKEREKMEEFRRMGCDRVSTKDEPMYKEEIDGSHPFDTYLFILSGQMDIKIGDDERGDYYLEGMSVIIPRNTKHSSRNGLDGCRFIVGEKD
ncbi:MAG: hypothetical protein A3B23_03350 [Candidatus Colwellbacteria bacterium RIFCSPLOWO2_01_FULL_48_10]|uniref:Uncharacterized protein n=2 Tax=Bacteria candidate phyla TaxID=1783234 RepID=A0A1F5NYJ3_9BACT|nr:MAG: hypothetical protein A2846_01575 [Candidatus Doudnabacteria bacterium RIFCSPHIGHO2_01_FULL_49_9]OGY59679.1 MAG: hypothetical protein A3B23_03350 [Candidatus Colwellbacteria bacterium RIFCSPLOWO2_01_FULL_48_10]